MSNIIKTLRKEIENSRTLINKKSGEILTYEKVKDITEKEYRKGMAKGDISLDVTYAIYEQEVIENNYIHVETLMTYLELQGFDTTATPVQETTGEQCEAMPEPEEK